MSDNESVESMTGDEATKKVGSSHPPYLAMVMDAVQAQQTRSAGVSRPKIVQYIKSKYKLEEVNGTALKNAIKKAFEKELLETKTGTGMNGTMVLSKAEKLKVTKEEKKKQKAEGTVSESEIKVKPKPKKVTKVSKDDIDLEKEKKKQAKKPPVAPKTTKGKENKWKKGDPVRKPKVLDAKVKQLTKSQSAGDILEPVASTSKQRTVKTKAK